MSRKGVICSLNWSRHLRQMQAQQQHKERNMLCQELHTMPLLFAFLLLSAFFLYLQLVLRSRASKQAPPVVPKKIVELPKFLRP